MENRKLPKVNVTGVVTAVSHLITPPNSGFYVKIFLKKPLCIRVKAKEHFPWLTSLQVGVTYRLSRVVPMEIKLSANETVQFVDVLAESVIQEVPSALPKTLQDICLAGLSYSGVITDSSIASMGIFGLQGGAKLCTSFITHRVYMESFKCLDPITVYNAHDTYIDGTRYYIMCGGSYAVTQPGCTPVPNCSSSLHPVVAFVLEKGLGFKDFLWLTNIFSKLKNLPNERSVLGDESFRKHVFGILNSLTFSNPSLQESCGVRSTFMKEFFLSNHECAVDVDLRHPDLEILTIEDCCNWTTSEITSDRFWTHKSHLKVNSDADGTKYVIIGKLDVEEAAPYLALNDGATLIRCVLIGASNCCTNIQSYIKKVVMIRKAVVVMEEFRLSSAHSGVNFEKEYVYMLLSPSDLHPICDSLESETKSSAQPKECPASQKEDENGFFSQHVVIHHVSTPVIYDARKQFYCLVSLLGHPVELKNSDHSIIEEFKEKGRLCLLFMNMYMFKYYPLLFENRVYEIKYPRSNGMHLFDKRVNFPALATGSIFLPLTEGVIIPNFSSITGPFTSPNLPDDDLVNKEIYRIRELGNVPFREVVHVQGILVFRSHQPAKFPRKRQIKDHHFGVPVEQNIIIELRDEECDSTIRLYLIAFAAKLYPLGLLPGSRVCIKFIEKRNSGNNKVFYQSTCFTSIRVMDCPKGLPSCERGVSSDNSERGISSDNLDSSKRHSYIAKELEGSSFLQSPFWGIFSISRFWKFEVLPLCRSCNSEIRYGRCSYVGCSFLLKDPLITANASFLVEDGSGDAYMYAKDENVRKLLGFSLSEWNELGAVASQNELLLQNRNYSGKQYSATNKTNMEQVVFTRLCEAVEMKPWHILCRKFVDDKNEEKLKLFCLDVQEIDLNRAEALS